MSGGAVGVKQEHVRFHDLDRLRVFATLSGSYFVVIRLDLPILPKYLLVVGLAFLGIMVPYELLIRRFNPLRVLFGLRPRRVES